MTSTMPEKVPKFNINDLVIVPYLENKFFKIVEVELRKMETRVSQSLIFHCLLVEIPSGYKRWVFEHYLDYPTPEEIVRLKNRI